MILVFVHGPKTILYVRRDSVFALELLRPDGTVGWDDRDVQHAGLTSRGM